MIKKAIIFLVFWVIVILFLGLLVKGSVSGGKLLFQDDYNTSVGGPFESSNSTSRYALTWSIVNLRQFSFTEELAKFSAPDIVFRGGKYFSIFPPGVSFLAVPLYLLGLKFGIPQLTSFFLTTMLALINLALIAMISRKIIKSNLIAVFSGIIFLFATNALPYAFTFTQHHASTAIILSLLLMVVSSPSIKINLLAGLLLSMGILIDLPNLWAMLPMGVFFFCRNLLSVSSGKIPFRINFSFIWIIIGAIPLFTLYGWYNNTLTDSPILIGQRIGRSAFPAPTNEPNYRDKEREKKSKYERKVTYNTRNLVQGLYILTISDERGFLYYSPILIIGLVGLVLLQKRTEHKLFFKVVIGAMSLIILSYSMFGDPWGGWSFGPRYLIPFAALLCLGITVAVDRFKKNIIFFVVGSILLFQSVRLNVLGAMTTAAIPPKQEAEDLVTPIDHTYEYNRKLLVHDKLNSSLFYDLYLNKWMSPVQFWDYYVFLVMILFGAIYVLVLREKGEDRI